MPMIFFAILVLVFLMFSVAPLFTIFSGLTLLLLFTGEIDSSAMIIEMYRLATTPILVAIPLFTFAGYLLSESKAPKRLIGLTDAVLGWLPGGLSIIALPGATGLTIIAMGGILLPALLRGRYPEAFSLGLVTNSGTLGLLFPPSLPIIIYAVVSKLSINQLFLAGLLPGFLMVLLLSLFSVQRAVATQVPRTRFQRTRVSQAIRDAIWELPLPLVVEVVIYRDIPWTQLPQIMRKSMILVGGILIILGSALGFTNYLIDAEV